ncbi:hypothetical protein [Actinomadura sp. HBU206391]|uniref:hypothetical protein n=1 Tax=Actinomadura sp. HBU206391 TaxID=2731692 RepID=UPI0016508EF9|nr:hypothetical protein [Actinomadura sp. HBU206391]MBC6457407.1 hypothetical protein [Actinomadura sp. HBU206391]
MARLRTTAAALVAAPSSVAAVTAITVHSAMGVPALAFRLAMLAGALTLLALVAALSQETIRSWIAHRAEQRRAAAEAHAIKTLFMAATGGPDRTPEDARQKRRDARAFAEAIGLTSIGQTSLGDAMQITRGRGIEGGSRHAGTGTDGRTGAQGVGGRAGGLAAGDPRSRGVASAGLELPMAATERPVRSVPPVTGEA